MTFDELVQRRVEEVRRRGWPPYTRLRIQLVPMGAKWWCSPFAILDDGNDEPTTVTLVADGAKDGDDWEPFSKGVAARAFALAAAHPCSEAKCKSGHPATMAFLWPGQIEWRKACASCCAGWRRVADTMGFVLAERQIATGQEPAGVFAPKLEID